MLLMHSVIFLLLFVNISDGSLYGGSPITSSTSSSSQQTLKPVKVAYQGEPGAYSEKAARELLGTRITPVNYESFEAAFKAVASKEVDYAVIPIENSLGGSIHMNYDLLLRYNLHIIGEHEFRVEHSLLALPGVKKENIYIDPGLGFGKFEQDSVDLLMNINDLVNEIPVVVGYSRKKFSKKLNLSKKEIFEHCINSGVTLVRMHLTN